MQIHITLGKVVYHLVPTSNHNYGQYVSCGWQLFIILFLHQTTTPEREGCWLYRCLSSCSYIKPQLQRHYQDTTCCCLSSCSYIKPQLALVVSVVSLGCLSSCSYIKPQHQLVASVLIDRCLSSCSYIKPQLPMSIRLSKIRCLSSCSYIKPQPY